MIKNQVFILNLIFLLYEVLGDQKTPHERTSVIVDPSIRLVEDDQQLKMIKKLGLNIRNHPPPGLFQPDLDCQTGLICQPSRHKYGLDFL